MNTPAELHEREMELNDAMIQNLYGVGLKLQYCQEVIDESPPQAKKALSDILDGLDGLIQEIRNRMYELVWNSNE
jgi:signal transduction histidine kinase